MEVRVLGPVEVLHEGRPLHLPRRQQRLILGILSLDANHAISRDRLISMLWGHHPPQQAVAVLQTRISELRAALNALPLASNELSLVTSGGDYLLRIRPELVDANQFRSLARTWQGFAPSEEARQGLRAALGLWRGPVLGGNLTEHAYGALGHGLESMRLTVSENLFEIELALGNHHQVVDEILELSTKNPDRERLMAQSMLALHRAGRTAQALRVYDSWRRWLGDELGIDPGTQVQQLHLAMLNSDAGLLLDTEKPRPAPEEDGSSDIREHAAFAAAVPRLLPPDTADFTGRTREVALMRELLSQPDAGVVVVAVAGRGGVGKTALSVHVAHRLLGEFPDGQLYADLHGVAEDEAAKPFNVLGRFLRALGVDGSVVPDTLTERVELYRDLLSERRVLVILDNAADDRQVLPLIPGGRWCGVIVNGRTRLGGTFGAHTIGLEAFDPEQASQLLSRIAGAPRIAAEPDAAADLSRQCGHLPLAIRVAGAKLAAKPHWSVSKLVHLLANERSRLSHFSHGHLDVRASISLSYSGLAPEAQRLLRRIGAINVLDTSIWLAAALLDTTCAEGEELLEQLFDAQLVDVSGHDPGGYPRYRCHDLVRLFAKERAGADEPHGELEAARTRAFGAWLCMSDAAYQAIYGGNYQNIRGTAPRWAVESHIVATMTSDPLRWFDKERRSVMAMVALAAADKRSAFCWELACTTSPLFQMRRQFDDWEGILRSALMAAREAADRNGEAAILYRMGWVLTDRTEYDTARQHFQRAFALFEEVGNRHGCATVRAYLGMIERVLGNDDVALDFYEQARTTLHDVGDLGGEAFALRAIGQLHLQHGALSDAEACFERALEIYLRCGARQGEAQVLFWQSMLRLQQERYSDALAGFQAALNICRRIGDRPGEAQCLRGLGLSYRRQGDLSRARSTLSDALRLVQQPRVTHLETHIRLSLAEL